MQGTEPIQKLFNLRILLLILITLMLVLLALFPWKTAKYMEQQGSELLREQFSSPIKTEYHQSLKKEKGNPEDILLLAQSMQEKDLWVESTFLLEKKINRSVLTAKQLKKYDLILLHNDIKAFHASSSLIKNNEKLKITVRKHLQKLEEDQGFNFSELQILAETSADFGLFPLAIHWYYQLANSNSIYQSQWLAEAGRWANQSTDYAAAAKAFKSAGEALNQPSNINKYTNDWLNAAINANQLEQIKPFFSKVVQQPPPSFQAVEQLANLSSQAGFYGIASQLFFHLAQCDHIKAKQRWYEKASHWSMEAEQYDTAADYLIKAGKVTNNATDQWVIQQRLITVYIKGKKPKLALDTLLAILKKNPKNHNLFDRAVYLALENNNIKMARLVNKKYLQIAPRSVDALGHQVDIEIKAEQYAEAIHFLKKIIKIIPKSLASRQQWAELEAQQGHYQVALTLWQRIYKTTNHPKHLQKVIQAAQLALEKEGLNTLLQIARQHELPVQAVYDVFFHLVNSKQKNMADKFLSQYLTIHNNTEKELFETLAKWYSGEKRYTEALQTWSHIETQFGPNSRSSLHKFELLWALKQIRKAHQLWVENKQQWSETANTRQLALMAEIAWQYKQTKTALSYYNKLLQRPYKRSAKEHELQYMRVAILNEKLGKLNLALSTYRKGFIKTGRTNLLINGLQLSFDRSDSRNFTRLITLAKKHKRQFRSKSRYWLLQAAYAQRNKNYRTALNYYKTVLSLRPKSREARAGIKAIRKYLRST